jgi:hypothetical protein
MQIVYLAKLLRRALWILPLWIGLTSLSADVTVRYQNDLKMASYLPQQAQEQAKKSMPAGQGMFLQFKNGKAVSKFGNMTSVVDYASKQVTLIDTEHKSYATLPVSEFTDQMAATVKAIMPAMPDEAKKAMAEMKTSVTSKAVESSDVIQGVQADEKEMVMTVAMPGGTGMTMKMVFRIWTAKPSETLRVQAIRELTGYNLYANQFMNPVESMKKMFEMFPGMGDTLKDMVDNLAQNKAFVLRVKVANYMQFSPEMLQKMGGNSPFGAGYDPNVPLSEMTQEVVELSTASVDAAAFQVPEGFQTAPAGDMLKSMMSGMMQAAKGAAK